jgi:hypothetical protein
MSKIPHPTWSSYSASKWAGRSFLHTLRVELQAAGSPVTVSQVHPGAIDTPVYGSTPSALDRGPRHPPEGYHPSVIAEALVGMAKKPRAEITVGAEAKALELIWTTSQQAGDLVMRAMYFYFMSGKQPGSDASALFNAAGKGVTSGTSSAARPSRCRCAWPRCRCGSCAERRSVRRMDAGTVEGAGVALAYREEGAGRPVVVVHDLGLVGTARDLAALGGRAIAYGRRGYAGSTAPRATPRPPSRSRPRISRRSCGRWMRRPRCCWAKASARWSRSTPPSATGAGRGPRARRRAAVRVRPGATQAMAEQRSAMEAALRDGGRDAAIAAYLGDSADPAERSRAQAHGAGFFADYAGLTSWPVTRRELRAISAAAVVLTRPGAAPHVVAASDALAALLPAAQRVRDGDPVAAVAAR